MPVVMISGHGTVALTAEAFRLGAHDFMEKPLRLVQVRTVVRNALEAIRLRKRVSEQEQQLLPKPVYKSAVMKTLYQQVARLATIAEPVVITGPSGSGKELVARALHYGGHRANGPFIATNAASMPVNLAEDELFGHEKGAFTGAHAQRKGCLEQADGGTLFLDEIADMDAQVQAKLLRVLEVGEFTRLGGTASVRVNVRVIAATHKNLEQLVDEGTFRHDLWYRLCAFVLRVPSLAERREDIPLLAELFLDTVCLDMGMKRQFTDDALEVLAASEFPGNIRELKHAVTRAAVFCEGEHIDASAIQRAVGLQVGPKNHSHGPEKLDRYISLDFRSAREQFEKDYLQALLQRNDGNITATAGAIGMAQSNLSRKLKELGLRAQ
jgi:two-component system nitrogen regulation response regulator NtrX